MAGFVTQLEQVPARSWQESAVPGEWSAAALALHVCQSYEFGVAAATGGAGMRMRVPRVAAWFARTLLLPRMLAAERFPRGARAPAEVVPDPAETRRLTPDAAITRLRRIAGEALHALQDADRHRPSVRITHAYFGPLRPLEALRLLSAHTRHHTAGIARRGTGVRIAPDDA